MKIEGSVADVTFVSPDRVEHDILGMILGVSLPVQAAIVFRGARCDMGFPS